MDFAVPADHRLKKWKKLKREISTYTLLENWKTMQDKNDGDKNCTWCPRYSHQRIGKGTKRIGNKSRSGDHPLLRSARILKRVLKTWRDLLLLKLLWKTITQTLVKDYYSNSCERLSANAGVKKKSHRSKIIIIMIVIDNVFAVYKSLLHPWRLCSVLWNYQHVVHQYSSTDTATVWKNTVLFYRID